MTVEDDHEYKLCPGAKWRKSWKDATWTDQSSDKHVTPAVKYDRALLNLLVTIHLVQKNNIFDLELKVSLCHVLSATSKPGEKSIQVRWMKYFTPNYTEICHNRRSWNFLLVA